MNEQIGLTALHTMWMRYHNTVEAQLHRLNPHWSGEKLFQETRRIIGAVWQHIVYNEYLPLVLGTSGVQRFSLGLRHRGYYDCKI